jgi:ketosteroid isomerase-like protein
MKQYTRRFIFFVLLSAPWLHAQTGAAAIEAAEKKWAASVVARDVAALDAIYSDDLIYAHSTGIIENKSEYMTRLKTGAQRYDAVTHNKITVRMHGDAAIAHCLMRMTGLSNQRPFDDKIMMIHVWSKKNGQWRLVAHQTTKLP